MSLLVLLALPVLPLAVAPRAAPLGFAGVLLAIAIRGAAEAAAEPLRLPHWLGVVAVVLATLALFGLGLWFAAPTLAAQADELLQRLPAAWAVVRGALDGTGWGRALLEEFSPGDVLTQVGPGAAGVATAAVTGAAGRPTDLIFLPLLGAFLAAAPAAYLAGLRRMVAPELRLRFDPVLLPLGGALRAWVGTQLLAMAIVGGLTFLGLTLLGMPWRGSWR